MWGRMLARLRRGSRTWGCGLTCGPHANSALVTHYWITPPAMEKAIAAFAEVTGMTDRTPKLPDFDDFDWGQGKSEWNCTRRNG